MKKFYSTLFLFFLFFISFQLKANDVVVKGSVSYANGTKASNITVKITVEAPCEIQHSVVTNSDGFYTDKLACQQTIQKLRLSISCNGQNITRDKEVPASNIVEVNFIMCEQAIACAAKFSSAPVASASQPFAIKFNSSSSETADGDKIAGRIWDFGDGEKMDGNVVDPTHNYKKPGVYEACLTIKTTKGCSKTKCAAIEIKTACKANFKFEVTSSGVRFNSSVSTSADNDPITARTWHFGDGTVLQGHIDPVHAFARPGTYTVCLVIRTNSGCESKECKQVIVPPANKVACSARFNFERIGPKKFRFNSTPSKTAEQDQIIERVWKIADASVTTNDVSIVHEFDKPGVYEVCLKIKTAQGCESKFCSAVKVEEGKQTKEDADIKILLLYPAPVHNELKTVIFSRNSAAGTLSIVDVYGQIKWTKSVNLVQGNNPFEIPVANLLPGPYFLRVTSPYGNASKLFHKI